ncbi:MAG: PilW family protein [Pseudomonadota bacterium]
MKTTRSPGRQRGVTLIELMISLAIGLVVVGAVLVSFVGSGRAGRYQAALGQMNQDAQVGLNLLAREVQMAGYVSPGQTLGGAPGIFGCDSTRSGTVSPFTDPEAAGATTCMPWTADFVSALEVVYEADLRTTVPSGAPPDPSDCLGAGITATSPNFFITRNRYHVQQSASGRNELHCSSPAATGNTQPLIENVEEMQLWYGVAAAAAPDTVVRYARAGRDASTLGTINAVGAAEWGNVISVRICLLMRSAEPVLIAEDTAATATPTYLDCNSNPIAYPDNFLRRAYFTTAMVRAKMAQYQ